MNMLFWSMGSVLLLMFLVKRLVRHRGTFEEFKARQDERYAQTVTALHKESGGLSPREAVEPVLAGMRELCGLQAGCSVLVRDAPEGPVAVLRLPQAEAEVAWVLLRARVRSGRLKDLRHGHFEVRLKRSGWEDSRATAGRPRRFEELADLMLFLREFYLQQLHPDRMNPPFV